MSLPASASLSGRFLSILAANPPVPRRNPTPAAAAGLVVEEAEAETGTEQPLPKRWRVDPAAREEARQQEVARLRDLARVAPLGIRIPGAGGYAAAAAEEGEDDGNDDPGEYSAHDSQNPSTDEERPDPMPQLYTPLREASTRAYQYQVDWLLGAGGRKHTGCFICLLQQRFDREEQRAAGQGGLKYEDIYAYLLVQDYYRRHPTLPPEVKARDINTLYARHIFDPAVRANGGRIPEHLPVPNVRVILEHILFYTTDPIAKKLLCAQKMEEFMMLCSDRVLVSNTIDPVAARYLQSSIKECWNMWDRVERQAGGTAQILAGPFALDYQRVAEFASSHALQRMAQQAGNALGGATATDNDAVMRTVNRQRPNYGALSSDEEDDASADDNEPLPPNQDDPMLVDDNDDADDEEEEEEGED